MKIICVGRNYAAHAKELNNSVEEEPVIFLKPDTALLNNNQDFYLPDFSNDIHYETEVVVKINKAGKHIDEKFAHRYYDSISLGIDFTARDLQSMLKAKGLPWEKAKAWDHSAIMGNWKPVQEFVDLQAIEFSLTKDGEMVQKGNSSLMIYPFHRIIAEISKYFSVNIGDVIFTGTPAGVGDVRPGDVLEGFIGADPMFKLEVN